MKIKTRKRPPRFLSRVVNVSTQRGQPPHRFMPRLDLRHTTLQFPVTGKNRFLQLERLGIEVPHFF